MQKARRLEWERVLESKKETGLEWVKESEKAKGLEWEREQAMKLWYQQKW